MSTNLTTDQAISMIMHQVTSISRRHEATLPSEREVANFRELLANELATHSDGLASVVLEAYSNGHADLLTAELI